MSFIYTKATELLLLGDLHLDTDDIRALLVGASSTADVDEDAATISAIGTLDEFSDASYSRKTLTGEAVARDDANDRSVFSADDVTWASLTGDTAKGVVVYKHVTNDGDSIPIAYIDGSGFPHVAAGGNLTVDLSTNGILRGSAI